MQDAVYGAGPNRDPERELLRAASAFLWEIQPATLRWVRLFLATTVEWAQLRDLDVMALVVWHAKAACPGRYGGPHVLCTDKLTVELIAAVFGVQISDRRICEVRHRLAKLGLVEVLHLGTRWLGKGSTKDGTIYDLIPAPLLARVGSWLQTDVQASGAAGNLEQADTCQQAPATNAGKALWGRHKGFTRIASEQVSVQVDADGWPVLSPAQVHDCVHGRRVAVRAARRRWLDQQSGVAERLQQAEQARQAKRDELDRQIAEANGFATVEEFRASLPPLPDPNPEFSFEGLIAVKVPVRRGTPPGSRCLYVEELLADPAARLSGVVPIAPPSSASPASTPARRRSRRRWPPCCRRSVRWSPRCRGCRAGSTPIDRASWSMSCCWMTPSRPSGCAPDALTRVSQLGGGWHRLSTMSYQ